MYKVKKLLSLLVVLLMVTTVLAGCGKQSTLGRSEKTTKDIVYEAFINDLDAKTQEFKVDMSIIIKGTNASDPQFGFMASLLENTKITLQGKTDTLAKKAEINASVNIGGMSFEGNIFVNDNIIALNIPILGIIMQDARLSSGYIVIDVNDLMEEFGQEQFDVFANNDEIIALSKKLLEMYLNLLDDNMFLNNGVKDITVGGSNTKATEVNISLGENEFRNILQNAMVMIKDPEFADLMFELMTVTKGYMTREEFDEELKNVIDEMESSESNLDELFEKISEVIDFGNSNIIMNLYINDKSSIVKTNSDVKIRLKDNGGFIELDLKVEADAWNINQPLNIQMPELNENNSIDFYELLFLYLGSLYF